jgi:ribulose-5-phosphate 4-epimerase/fuculose-1-phosphate aldolase
MCKSTHNSAGEIAQKNIVEDPSLDNADRALIEELVIANWILDEHRVVDAFGHISVRHDKRSDRFLLARNMAPRNVAVEDIMAFDLDGTPVNANGRGVYLERFLHAEIYRARPDVMSIVHSHSPAVLPFTIVKEAPLRPVYHMSSFIGERAPVFEIRDVAGTGSDMLIKNNPLGVALARSLGSAALVLMRGHGSTVVAPSIQQAVYQAIYTEINARIQAEASQMGEVTYLTAEEAIAADVNVAGQMKRPWDLWKADVLKKRSAARSPE